MSTIDPRFAARRREVREASARHRLRWVLAALVVLGGALGAWWLLQSPYLAVERIAVTGVERAEIYDGLARAGVREGMSVAWVRTGRIEEAIRSDPWVRDAAVRIDFPHVVEVEVLEYEPFAALETEDGWRLVAADGAVLADVAEPPAGLGVVAGAVSGRPGASIEDAATAAAIEYLAGLTADLRAGATVVLGTDVIRATVAGRTVLLGTWLDIGAKAAVTTSLLEGGVDEGWSLDVTAPGRPALVPPILPAPPEPEDEAPAEAEPEGQGG